MGLHEGSVLLKDLPPSRPNKTHMNNKREICQNNVGNLEGPIPYGFTWGLVLLKALPKSPVSLKVLIPINWLINPRIFM